jgi:TRAP-type C4-dicarboxylate transport system substrate-binding protein
MGLRFSLFVTAILSTIMIATGATAQPIELKFSHFLGPTSFFQQDVVEPWARELEAKTNGRVKVETFNGSSPLGKVTEQATNVKTGAVDIALGLAGAEGDRFPGTSLIELPFIVPDSARGSKALWDLYTDGTLAPEYKDYKVLALFVHNPGLVHTTSKRVVGPNDMKGLRLRSPNRTVAAALEHLGATPVILQVNEVMDAVRANRIDGIVTNWGNPLQGFNDAMKFHTDTQFYAAAFFIVMNKDKYESLPAEIRSAIDGMSGATFVARFGPLWDKWDKPVRDGAAGPGHEIIKPDAATMEEWRAALRPVTERYLEGLPARGFPNARAAYDTLVTTLRR